MSLEAVGDDSVRRIVRRDTNLNTVSNRHADAVFLHSAGKDRPDDDPVFTFDFLVPPTESLNHNPGQLNQIASAQRSPLSRVILWEPAQKFRKKAEMPFSNSISAMRNQHP